MKYQTSKEWLEAVKYRTRQLFEGLWGLFFYGIVMGVASLTVYCGKQIAAFFLRERVAGVIIAVLLALMTFGWLATFINGRAKTVRTQHIADSLSYELSKYEQLHDGTEKFIIDGDTITVENYYPKNE